MAADHVAGDGETEPRSAGARVARTVDPVERLEHVLARGLGDSRPVVVDDDFDRVPCPAGVNRHMLGVADGV